MKKNSKKNSSLLPVIHKGKFYNFHGFEKIEHAESVFSAFKMYFGSFHNFMKIPDTKHAWIEPHSVMLPSSEQPVITWLGHATMLIQSKGVNILTDPIFGSPAFLYKRVLPFGIEKEKLPHIHVVMISHNHRDHMDKKTIIYLQKHFKPVFLVPQGDKKWFINNGCTDVHESVWWDTYTYQETGLAFTFVPAWHWSQRSLLDHNKSLWGGWVVQSQEHTIYFAGDTAYKKQYFTAIKEQFPNIDVALMPIAPGDPDELMRKSHVNAKESVQAFIDCGAKMFIPMHWGAFYFGHDDFERPIHSLKKWWHHFFGATKECELRLVKLAEKVFITK